MNLIVGGDWLQLPPVRAKSIFRNPFLKDCVSVERRILNMFWQMEDVKGIPSSPALLFELTEPLRSRDLWLNYVLSCDRSGAEPWEVYCFMHGLLTRHVGSWLHDHDLPICGNKECQNLQDHTWPKELLDLHWSWDEMQEQECEHCETMPTARRPDLR